MKKHAIIPVFISHRGCPNDCVFCNQKKITAREGDVTPDDVRQTIEQWLTTLENVETVEVSFYGGSFTGLPQEQQNELLEIAREYKEAGRINAIHLSTRPDYISPEILENLKRYSVDVIELGVQSFSDDVLKASGRGHDSSVVYSSCALIKDFGFTLGIQLMIGLPGDSEENCIFSAEETVRLAPSIARLYPTVTIEGTALYDMWKRGEYSPLSLEEAVRRTRLMYEILEDAGINIIRVGLKASEIMDREVGFHPAFRQLVESEIAKNRLEPSLSRLNAELLRSSSSELPVTVYANSRSYGNIFGHKGSNRSFFAKKYPHLIIRGAVCDSLRDNEYKVSPSE